jgi:hypothetical protein
MTVVSIQGPMLSSQFRAIFDIFVIKNWHLNANLVLHFCRNLQRFKSKTPIFVPAHLANIFCDNNIGPRSLQSAVRKHKKAVPFYSVGDKGSLFFETG